MEENQNSNQFLERSKIYSSPKLNRVKTHTKSNESGDDRKTNEKNLRNKLDNAFSDLESLRTALKDIKYKKENSYAHQNSNKLGPKDVNNWEAKSNRFSPSMNDYNYTNDEDERNGGSRSRSNSNNKSLNYNSYVNQKVYKNSYYKTPKANNAKSNFLIFYNFY
jgi:hypothetical protein